FRGARPWVPANSSEVGHQKRPTYEPKELHRGGEDTDRRRDRQQGRVGVAYRTRQHHNEWREKHSRHREAPPEQHEAGAAGPEASENLEGWPTQDLGVVEAG